MRSSTFEPSTAQEVIDHLRDTPDRGFMHGGCSMLALTLHRMIAGSTLHIVGRVHEDEIIADHACVGVRDSAGELHLADGRRMAPVDEFVPLYAMYLRSTKPHDRRPVATEPTTADWLEHLINIEAHGWWPLDDPRGAAIMEAMPAIIDEVLSVRVDQLMALAKKRVAA